MVTARRLVCALLVVVLLISGCQQWSVHPSEPLAVSVVASQATWAIDAVRLAQIEGDTVFVSNPPHYVATFDLKTGTFIWQENDADLLIGAPIAANSDYLFVVTGEGIAALDAATGAVQWQTAVPADGEYQELAAIEEEQMIVYGDITPFADSQVLYAMSSQTGDMVWQVELPGSIDWYGRSIDPQRHSAIAYDRGRLYLRTAWCVEGRSGNLFSILAIDPQDGTELWRFDFGVKQLPGEEPLFGADSLAFGEDTVYIPSYLGPLYTVNDSGVLRAVDDEWWVSLTRTDDLIVAEVLHEGIVAIDQATGTEVWTTSLEEEPLGIPQLASLRDYLFVEVSQANKSRIAVVDLTSGERVQTITLPSSPACSTPLILDTCGEQLCLGNFSINRGP